MNDFLETRPPRHPRARGRTYKLVTRPIAWVILGRTSERDGERIEAGKKVDAAPQGQNSIAVLVHVVAVDVNMVENGQREAGEGPLRGFLDDGEVKSLDRGKSETGSAPGEERTAGEEGSREVEKVVEVSSLVKGWRDEIVEDRASELEGKESNGCGRKRSRAAARQEGKGEGDGCCAEERVA